MLMLAYPRLPANNRRRPECLAPTWHTITATGRLLNDIATGAINCRSLPRYSPAKGPQLDYLAAQ
jgi:hypothetical protein